VCKTRYHHRNSSLRDQAAWAYQKKGRQGPIVFIGQQCSVARSPLVARGFCEGGVSWDEASSCRGLGLGRETVHDRNYPALWTEEREGKLLRSGWGGGGLGTRVHRNKVNGFYKSCEDKALSFSETIFIHEKGTASTSSGLESRESECLWIGGALYF